MASIVVAWPMVALGEVLVPVSRQEAVQAAMEYRLLGIRLDGNGPFLRETKLGSQLAATTLSSVAAGDFIYSRLFAWRGAFGTIDLELDGCYVSGEFPTFRPVPEKLDNEYLRLWFRLPSTLAAVEADCSGSTPLTRNRFKEQFFLAMQVPLPPLDEQRRIVARIEALAARIEQAQGLRREAMAEADALWGAYAYESLENLNEVIPRAIADIAEVRGGIQKSPARTVVSNPVRYLTVAHVQRNHVAVDDPRYFEVAPDELERWRLRAGDVLIVEGNGSADQIGRTALFRGEIDPCVHQNHVIRIRPVQSLVDPEYLNLYLNSPVGQSEVQSRSRTTSGLNILSVGRINSIKVPIPSLVAQHRIVARLRDVRAKSTLLKQVQQGVAEELDALLPSVLDKAFRGEL